MRDGRWQSIDAKRNVGSSGGIQHLYTSSSWGNRLKDESLADFAQICCQLLIASLDNNGLQVAGNRLKRTCVLENGKAFSKEQKGRGMVEE
jgi:hypothetical protein